MSNSVSSNQLQIWGNRLSKEILTLKETNGKNKKLPPEASLTSDNIDTSVGNGRLRFHLSIKDKEDVAKFLNDTTLDIDNSSKKAPESTEDNQKGETVDSNSFELVSKLDIEFDFNISRTNFPFGPPIVKVLEGSEYVPPSCLYRGKNIRLQELENWSHGNSKLIPRFLIQS